MRIGVLNNLRAGRSHKQVSRILEVLRAYPDVVHVETESARALPEAIADLAAEDVELLILNGGDGTLQFALTEILAGDEFAQTPLIAPLRGGRTNMTALDLGAQSDPVRGLSNVLAAAYSGRIHERLEHRPVLRVQSAKARETRYGMFFGAGMIHRAIALTHRLFPPGRAQGVVGAGVVTGGLIAKACMQRADGVLVPDKLQIFLDGELVPRGEFSLVIASSLERLFLRMNPFWGEERAPVRFTSIAAGARGKLKAAPGILRGKPRPSVFDDEDYTSRNAHVAELRLDCGYTVDGEIFSAGADDLVTITADRRVSFVRA